MNPRNISYHLPLANYADTGDCQWVQKPENEPQKRESSTFCRKSEVWINKNKPDKQNNLIQVNKLNKVEYDISPEQ